METEVKLKGLQKVDPHELVIGMYIAQLDKDWRDSDYMVQGFYLRSANMIDKVRQECEYVLVDPRRYDSSLGEVKLHAVEFTSSKPKEVDPRAGGLTPKKPVVYKDAIETNDEMPAAQTSLQEAEVILESCITKLQTAGGFDVDEIEAAISPLVQSVMRNRTALAALTRMRRQDNYLYSHAISCAVWGTVLGRELGLPPKDIERIALVCAVMDIGKLSLPDDILHSDKGLDSDQWRIVKGHVASSVEMMRANGFTDEQSLAAIESHHERHDGSGYPNGLEAVAIPAFGRIAGIVDSYDAMVSDRPYAKTKSSYDAIQELDRNADKLFQRELVDYFIKAIGLFPVGSTVELNTGEVGIVVSQTAGNRLKPKIMLVLDESKNLRSNLVIIDLVAQEGENKPLTWWITKELPLNAYGIDPQKYFLD